LGALLSVSAAVSLCVTYADYRWANGIRDAVALLDQRTSGISGRRWFQGHWGAQYYFQQAGWSPLAHGVVVHVGDVVARPMVVTNLIGLDSRRFLVREVIRMELSPTACLIGSGAGFYACVYGDCPFVLGVRQTDFYTLSELVK